MSLALLSLLMTLFASFSSGPPLHIPDEGEIRYLSPIRVPSTMAYTSLASDHLQGPVHDVRLEVTDPNGKDTTLHQLLQIVQYDSHGNLTEMQRFLPGEKESVVMPNDSYAIANSYDTQGRLQQLTLTQQHLPQEKVVATRNYDQQGRLFGIGIQMQVNSSGQYTRLRLLRRTLWMTRGGWRCNRCVSMWQVNNSSSSRAFFIMPRMEPSPKNNISLRKDRCHSGVSITRKAG